MCRINGVNPQTGAWMPLFASYNIATLPEEVVIHGRLRPDLTEDHPLVRSVLEEWDGRWYAAELDGETDLVLIGRTGEETPLRWKLNLILFLLTLVTTFTAGALLRGVDPLQTEFLRWRDIWIPYPTGFGFRELLAGAPFAVCLLVVLLGHELGHYFAARFHRVRTTLPYFIPFPPYFSVIGTLGAFIRIQSPMVRRAILLDVGAAGPLASFALSLPMDWWESSGQWDRSPLPRWFGGFGAGRAPSGGLRRVARALRHRFEPPPPWAAGRRTYPLRFRTGRPGSNREGIPPRALTSGAPLVGVVALGCGGLDHGSAKGESPRPPPGISTPGAW